MFPAGFIDYGEHPSETVIREMAEETGLRGFDPQLIGIFQVDDDPRSMGHFTIFYKVNAYEGEIATDPEENQAIAWFELDRLPPIGWKQHQHVAKLLQEGSI